jgi:hypothetical protein
LLLYRLGRLARGRSASETMPTHVERWGVVVYDDVQHDLSQSSNDFLRLVWPILQRECEDFRKGEIRMVEGRQKGNIPFDLDVIAGIDAYLREPGALRGMALRTQRTQRDCNYCTFTVRETRPNGSLTEYAKRREAIKRRNEGVLYPWWTIQAYLSKAGDQVLSIGVARTVELYEFIEQSRQPLDQKRASNGGETFFCVKWDDYGRNLFTYPLKN